jgi:hypothetical protein
LIACGTVASFDRSTFEKYNGGQMSRFKKVTVNKVLQSNVPKAIKGINGQAYGGHSYWTQLQESQCQMEKIIKPSPLILASTFY